MAGASATVLVVAFAIVRNRGPRWLSETSNPTWARALMFLGVDPTADIPGRVSPLDRQAMEGNVEVVRVMLESGADPDRRDKLGFTPLFSAVHAGHLATVRVLVERGGADVDLVADCWTPYQYALEYERTEIAEYLRARGARTDPASCR